MKIKVWAYAILFALSFSATAQNHIQQHHDWIVFEQNGFHSASTTGDQGSILLKSCNESSPCSLYIDTIRPCSKKEIELIATIAYAKNLVAKATCLTHKEKSDRYIYTILNDVELSEVLRKEGGSILVAFDGIFRENYSLGGAREAMQVAETLSVLINASALQNTTQSSNYQANPSESDQSPTTLAAPQSSSPSVYEASSYTPSPCVSSKCGFVQVRGYTRKDGTYVQPHTRSRPRR